MYRRYTATVLNPTPSLKRSAIMDMLETSCKAVVAADVAAVGCRTDCSAAQAVAED